MEWKTEGWQLGWQTNRRMGRWLAVAAWTIVLSLAAAATTVTGTIKVNQVPFNGAFTYRLIYPTSAGGTGYLSLPAASDPVPVTNGQFASLSLDGNDIMLPRGTYYQFTFSNNYGSVVATLNYFISGSTYDIGTAVPTPVTTNNVNFLDLLGIRNFSTTNMSVLNCFNVGSGAATPAFCPTGITGLKSLDGIQFADAYNGIGSSSTTCGIAEAEAALPAAGGIVYLPLGTCTLTTTITHTKSARWIGHGLGTTLISTAAYLVDAQGWLQVEGATLQGGTTATIYDENTLLLYTVGVSASSGSGLILATNSTANAYSSSFTGNAGSGVVSNGNFVAYSSTFANNTGDGITANAASTILHSSNATGNTGSGLNVPTGSTAVTDWEGGLGGGNTQAGFFLQGSAVHHTIQNVDMRGNSRQHYGVYINPPTGGDPQLAQVTIKDDQLTGNLTDDVFVGSNAQRVYYYPLVNTKAATGYTESILAPNAVFYIGTSHSPTFTSQSFSVSGCTPALSTDSNCTGTITLPTAMADNAYIPSLTVNATAFSGGGPGPFLSIEATGALTTTTIPYDITCTFGCSVATTNTIYVNIIHP